MLVKEVPGNWLWILVSGQYLCSNADKEQVLNVDRIVKTRELSHYCIITDISDNYENNCES